MHKGIQYDIVVYRKKKTRKKPKYPLLEVDNLYIQQSK